MAAVEGPVRQSKKAVRISAEHPCSFCAWPTWQDAKNVTRKKFYIESDTLDKPRLFLPEIAKSKSHGKLSCLGCAVLNEALQYVQETFGDRVAKRLELIFPKDSSHISTAWSKRPKAPVGFFMFTVPGRPSIAEINSRNPALIDTSPSNSVPQILRWLSSCSRHKKCRKLDLEGYLPPRLIDLGTADQPEVKLVNAPQQSIPGSRYVCLSHCWGKSNLNRTLTSNLTANLEGIPVQKLSATFQQAIEVTRSLGLRYIWIDSICIVQDDVEDWNRHVTEMSQIYRRAFLTLAAGASKSSEEGLFRARTNEKMRTRTFWHENVSYEVSFCPWPDHGYRHDAVVDEQWPLMQRGWVYQEHMLSRRFVTFGPDEVTWVCQDCRHCTCDSFANVVSSWWENIVHANPDTVDSEDEDDHGTDEDNDSTDHENDENYRRRSYLPYSAAYDRLEFDSFHESFFGDAVKLQINKIESKHPPHMRDLWGNIIECYSPLKLTVPSDKLPAIAGIARYFQSVYHDEFVSGFWKKDLKYSLTWYLRPSSSSRMPKTGRPRIGPSWAWTSASDDGAIAYLGHPEKESFDITVVEIVRSPRGEFFDLESGCLTIEGTLFSISLELEYDFTSEDNSRVYVKEMWGPRTKSAKPKQYPVSRTRSYVDFRMDFRLGEDVEQVNNRLKQAKLLLSQASEQTCSLVIAGIVLIERKQDEPSETASHPCYERIGYLHSALQFDFDDERTEMAWYDESLSGELPRWAEGRTTFKLI